MSRVVRALALWVVVWPLMAHAEDEDTAAARVHADRARQAIVAGNLREALSEFQQSLDAQETADVLYELAEAELEAGHLSEARHHYSRYLAVAPGGYFVRRANLRIDEIDEREHARARVAKGAARKTPMGREKILAAIGVSLTGAGAILSATGIAFAARAKSASDELSARNRDYGSYDPALDASGRSAQAIAGGTLGVGLVCLAVGATLTALYAKKGFER